MYVDARDPYGRTHLVAGIASYCCPNTHPHRVVRVLVEAEQDTALATSSAVLHRHAAGSRTNQLRSKRFYGNPPPRSAPTVEGRSPRAHAGERSPRDAPSAGRGARKAACLYPRRVP